MWGALLRGEEFKPEPDGEASSEDIVIGCMAAYGLSGVGRPHIVDRVINAIKYIDILQKCMAGVISI